MLTRASYVKLARAIDNARVIAQKIDQDTMQLELVVRYICKELAEDNPRFDEDKFREACGVEKL